MPTVLEVATANLYRYRGPDVLDITRGQEQRAPAAEGLAFAPSWAILRPALVKLRARTLTPEGWRAYAEAYTAEMRASYRTRREAWAALLARRHVVLVCHCAITPERPWCHRRVLAGILEHLGACDVGEVAC